MVRKSQEFCSAFCYFVSHSSQSIHLSLTNPFVWPVACAENIALGSLSAAARLPSRMIPKRPVSWRTMLFSGTQRCTSRTAYGYTTQTHMQADGSYNCGQHLLRSRKFLDHPKRKCILRIGNLIKIYPVSVRVIVLAHLSRASFGWSPVWRIQYVVRVMSQFLLCIHWQGSFVDPIKSFYVYSVASWVEEMFYPEYALSMLLSMKTLFISIFYVFGGWVGKKKGKKCVFFYINKF